LAAVVGTAEAVPYPCCRAQVSAQKRGANLGHPLVFPLTVKPCLSRNLFCETSSIT